MHRETGIYPNGFTDLRRLGFSSVGAEIAFSENEDGTISLKVEKVSQDITNGSEKLTLPKNIGGKSISSISYAEDIDSSNINVECSSHYREWDFDATKH